MSPAVEMSLARIDSALRRERPLGERFAATPRIACEALGAGDLEAAPDLPTPPTPTLLLRRTGEEWRIALAAPWGLPATEPLEAIGP